MRDRSLWLIAGPMVLIIIGSITLQVYGHGVAACCWSGFYQVQNDFFTPPRTIVGETIVITGDLRSLVNRPLTLQPVPVIDRSTNSSALDAPANSTSPAWELVSLSLPHEFILNPGDTVPFRIEIKALKEGSFRLQPAFNATGIGISLTRAWPINVYPDKEALNANETSFYMLTVNGTNYVAQYRIFQETDIEGEMVNGMEITSMAAEPENMALNISLSAMEGQTSQPLSEIKGYFDVELSGDLPYAIGAPGKFDTYVDGERVEPIGTAFSCNWLSVRVPISGDLQEIRLEGAESLRYDDSLRATAKFVRPLDVIVDRPGEDRNDVYSFGVGIATNAQRCYSSLVKEENKLHIDLDGSSRQVGVDEQRFLSIAIPHQMLVGNYTILVDGNVVTDFNEQLVNDGSEIFQDGAFEQGMITNGSWSVITLNYTADAREIDIVGTRVIPEFGLLSSAAPAILAAIAIGVIVALVRAGAFRNAMSLGRL